LITKSDSWAYSSPELWIDTCDALSCYREAGCDGWVKDREVWIVGMYGACIVVAHTVVEVEPMSDLPVVLPVEGKGVYEYLPL